jgi:hypothetical protein
MVAFPVCSVESIAVPPATNSLLINTLTLDANILHSDLRLEPIAR